MSAAVWTPMSGCGAHCLRGDEAPAVGLAARAGRLAGLVLVMLGAAVVSPVLPLLPYRWRAWIVRGCARNTLRAVGVRWRGRGRVPAPKGLGVGHHVAGVGLAAVPAARGARPWG